MAPVMMVTGSTKGMGKEIATTYLERGYVVAGCSRGASSITHDRYYHTQLDVANEKDVRSWVRETRKRSGRIDVLICNAGLAPAAHLMTMTSGELFESVLRTNISGTFYVCREVARIMVGQRSGRIITVSSMAVGLHEEGTAVYTASKSAVVSMTRILAKEVAPAGVTCNVIAPSMFPSEQLTNLGDAVTARALERLAVKRPLTTEEICHVIDFYIAPVSGCITGQVIQLGMVS